MSTSESFLQAIPERRLQSRETEEGQTIVFRPRFGESRFARWLSGLLGLEDYRIRLDEIGGTVWRQCNGSNTVQDIAETVRAEFGESVEPAEDRVRTFMVQMNRARMVSIHRPPRGSDGSDEIHCSD